MDFEWRATIYSNYKATSKKKKNDNNEWKKK